MSEIKQNKYSNFMAAGSPAHQGGITAVLDAPQRTGATRKGGDVNSWDAYKNWLTKVQAPEQKRSLPDPALFSFKGYRSWAEKIRRDWDASDD